MNANLNVKELRFTEATYGATARFLMGSDTNRWNFTKIIAGRLGGRLVGRGNTETSRGDLPKAPKGLRSGLWVWVHLRTEAAKNPRPKRNISSTYKNLAEVGRSGGRAPQPAFIGF